jgi:O-antigen/teichoic acid export membrane protein
MAAHFSPKSPELNLTSGRLLARNTIWNLAGNAAPFVVAIFSIPILIRNLGTDRFGVLALAWAIVGYASLFDLGLGRALTQLVARKLGADQHDEIPALVWTSLILMTVLGIVGGVFLAVASPWLGIRVLHVPVWLQTETTRSFYLLSLSVPIVVGTAGLRGFLEAHQRFDVVNLLRIPLGIFAFAGPLLVLPFSKTLPPVVGILVLGRLAAWIAYLVFCFKVSPVLRDRILWHRQAVVPLMKFGGWMTVTNVIGPLMVTLDRLVIGALLSVAAVAYYATPYEAITKLWIVPSSIVAVVFPAFSTSLIGHPERASLLYDRSVKYVLVTLFPIVLVVMLFAPEILNLWLGRDFAAHSSIVLQWLAIGVFINSLALVPATLIQGSGRPDATAKLHALELPLYLLAMWLLIRSHGIEGAAIAWTGRVVLDALALFVLPAILDETKVTLRMRTFVLLFLAPLVLAASTLLQGFTVRMVMLLLVVGSFAVASWFLILTRDERDLALTFGYAHRDLNSISTR